MYFSDDAVDAATLSPRGTTAGTKSLRRTTRSAARVASAAPAAAADSAATANAAAAATAASAATDGVGGVKVSVLSAKAQPCLHRR